MVSSRQEASASVFGAIAEATGTLTWNAKPHHVQVGLSAESFVTLESSREEDRERKGLPAFL